MYINAYSSVNFSLPPRESYDTITILSYKDTCMSEMALECDAAIIWKHQITQTMLDYLLLKQGSQQCLRVQHGSTLPVGYSKQ